MFLGQGRYEGGVSIYLFIFDSVSIQVMSWVLSDSTGAIWWVIRLVVACRNCRLIVGYGFFGRYLMG